jgi:hypothetical protein
MKLLTSINEEPARVTSELSSGITTPVVTPPAAKPWVIAPNDNVGHEAFGAAFNAPLTLPSPPVKGSVVLSIENAGSGGGMPTIDVAVYDGTTWKDLSTIWSLAPSTSPPSFRWWCADRSYVDDGMFDPSSSTAAAWAWAEADGIHILWNGQGSATTPDEHTLAYPAGVTQADMPPSKTF